MIFSPGGRCLTYVATAGVYIDFFHCCQFYSKFEHTSYVELNQTNRFVMTSKSPTVRVIVGLPYNRPEQPLSDAPPPV